MLRRRVYIAGALTGAKAADYAVYRRVREGCVLAGFEAYLPYEDTGPREAEIPPSRVLEANLSAINSCVAVVAEVSVPSHGVGIEIQHALLRGIPVFGLARKGTDVSRMVRGHLAVRGGINYFSSPKAIPQMVRGLLMAHLQAVGHRRSHLIAIEGPDHVGKSAVARALAEWLEKLFSGTTVERVSDPPWHLDPWHQISEIFLGHARLTQRAEALLFLAGRVDNWRRTIEPAFKQGRFVVADRFIDSWLAYEAVGLSGDSQELGKAREFGKAFEFLLAEEMLLESFGFIDLPGLTILLMAEFDELLRRRQYQGRPVPTHDERERLFAVMDAFEQLSVRFPQRIARVETTGRSQEEVNRIVQGAVEAYLSVQLPKAREPQKSRLMSGEGSG